MYEINKKYECRKMCNKNIFGIYLCKYSLRLSV